MEFVIEARSSQFFKVSFEELTVNLNAHGTVYLLEHALYLELFSKSKETFSEVSDVNYIVCNIYNIELL